MVVAPQPAAAEIGAAILADGGTAFDAAIASVFMQAAADPFMCGIGGFGIAQVFVAKTGENLCVEFYGRAPNAARPDMWADRLHQLAADKVYVEGFGNEIGYGSIAVPGTVAGMAEIHRRWGKLPWSELVRPAEQFLRNGYPLYQSIADYFVYPGGPPAKPTQLQRFGATPEMARIWLKPDGTLRNLGEPVLLADYADTMFRLAQLGPDDFYRGGIAAEIAADLKANGALLTADDLRDYQVKVLPALTGTYRDAIVSVPPPPGGGVTLLQMLNILERFEIRALGHNSPQYLHVLASAMRAAAKERSAKLGDPGFITVPVEQMVDKDWAAAIAAEIRSSGPTATVESRLADPGTTHLTCCDREGNAVAVTHTLGMGSGVITKGLGFQYNNCMGGFDPRPGHANSAAPGKARISAMSPTMVMHNGRPLLVLGSPGSNAIVNAILQVVINSIDFGLSPLEAVSEPRIHCEGATVSLETRILRATAAALASQGHEVVHGPIGYDTLQGRVQLAVATAEVGQWLGASDPRRDGGIAISG